MRMDPFIEAEEATGHSVQHCCELFEVSRSAYYARRQAAPSAKQLSDAGLVEQIRGIHDESDGTYGSPRVHRELRHRGVDCGRRRVARLMRLAGLEGRCKKRWRTTTIPDPRRSPRPHPAGLSTRAWSWTPATAGTSPTSRPGRAGLTSPRSSTWPAAGSWAGRWPSTCAPSWSLTPSRWPSAPAARRRGPFFIPTTGPWAIHVKGISRPGSTPRRGALPRSKR
ncbi:MAG: IS3 family transposase [Acidimicrobiia bacterium]|nr:IS3 family transposase [Acidimicrobiia bacterium]